MNYTREDDRKLAEAMGWTVFISQSGYYFMHEIDGVGIPMSRYLTAPTPQSDYECLEWARKHTNLAVLEHHIAKELPEGDLLYWFLGDYQPGMIARALYAVLVESEE